MANRVTIVTVAYNSEEVLPQMLASVPADVPVIVVDNASRDAAATKTIVDKAGGQYLRSEKNLGFGGGCNLGAARADGDFLLFLNPDARLEEGALEALLAAAERYPDCVAMNPRIKGRNGRAYFKRRSVLLPRDAYLPRGWPDTDREVPVLTGAAFFVRRSEFDAVGGFDEKIFLYHEDDDLSLRLAQRGKLFFVREAVVFHEEGHSSERSVEGARFKARHLGRSRVYALRKHGRPHPFLGSFLAALGQLLSPENLLSRRKRAKQVAFLRGVSDMRYKGISTGDFSGR
ncbi:glycosyltransferase family 2 protein [Thioclava atlantica]|uniref:Glycosyl transferase family protein n=1 Tax=Thioclava atlantica TaxID=1317124 RepID=A0A085TTI0_9RHOB|nr:glycosyltransferase family 2 protein [Thioclava atlantica]KFE34027.1 glycosyl transferase family protein [Thioclava atlantica]